jgi:signal transduction histidine kinase
VIRVHPDLVSEALSNLLDNAIRYTPRGGTVAVSFGLRPPAIIVSDSGPGISEAERELVFERFSRGSTGSDRGSGLGLSIVREIARLHGGEVLLQTAPQGGLQVIMQFSAG